MKEKIKSKLLALFQAKFNEKLKRTNQFAYGISKVLGHDVASPLTVIVGHAERLLNKSTDPAVKTSAEKILNAAKNQRMIIDAAREYIHIFQKRREIDLSSMSTFDLLDALLPSFDDELKKFNITLVVNKGEVPLQLLCDPYMTLDRVMTPILANAIKYTPEGGVIELFIKEENGLIHLSLSNPYKQLTKIQLEQLFFMHHDEKSLGVRGEAGRGYSLAIAEGFMNLFGGKLSATSTEEKFTITATFKRAE